ncbi:Mss4-like protein [Mycena rosella]|uniref:Mss4-like protein n=1 Tax=Mycena rosella TaxID=1033263 RepID=A0AAD7D9L7_MYCRO|nr:Mss4-like protein [Mycena rosella]
MSESTESAQVIDYRGNCHCGAFKFTFRAPELKQAFACNCSICSRNGYLWAFPASSEDFVVVKGDEDSTLKSYEFGKRAMAHKFCPTCGTSVLARIKNPVNGQSLAINTRALMDVDFASLPVLNSDGAATEPLYQAPEPMDAGPVPEGAITYNGHCHCGAVAYSLLADETITTAKYCNCSICSRDGALWIYPPTAKITFKREDSMTEWTFGRRDTYHGFCKICGVAIRERFDQPGRLDTALNVRTMNGLNLGALEIKTLDGKGLLPPYEV